MTALIEQALKATEFCRDWRNRRIAHRDLALALNQPATPLAAGSRAQVHDALKAIADVMNAVQLHYFDGQTAYDVASLRGGAVTLLHLLAEGLKAKEDGTADVVH